MIYSTMAIFVSAFAVELAKTLPGAAVIAVSYFLSIILAPIVRWGITVYLFPPGSLTGDTGPQPKDLP